MRLLFILSSFFAIYSCSTPKLLVNNEFTDSDLDGVPDYRDACPNEAGSPFNMGCPKSSTSIEETVSKLSTDTDLDGVPDDKDECPKQYGSPFNQGCP